MQGGGAECAQYGDTASSGARDVVAEAEGREVVDEAPPGAPARYARFREVDGVSRCEEAPHEDVVVEPRRQPALAAECFFVAKSKQ